MCISVCIAIVHNFHLVVCLDTDPGQGTTTTQPTYDTDYPTLNVVPVPAPSFATNPPSVSPTDETPSPVDGGGNDTPSPVDSGVNNPSPTSAPTDDGDAKASNNVTSSWLFWLLIVILVLLLCCCCCGIIYFLTSSKRGNAYFGNTGNDGL